MARIPRKATIFLGLVVAVALVGVQPVGAVPVDINPDVSDNANANASTGGRVNHMASVPGNNDVFYLASEYGGVFRSNDAGVNWTRLNGHLPVVAWDVEVDAANTNRVIASSWYDGRVNPLSGVQVSIDGGTTWTHPATSWPDPALEGTANDNTPPGWSCANVRAEPSGYGISISGTTIAVGTNCGLALSTNSGSTWTFVDPTPATPASRIWDVNIQAGGIIDICGDTDDHMRSTNNGTSFVPGGVLPAGRCSVAASPDENDVLFVFASDNNVYESDDAGANWFNMGNPTPQGRIPFVVTNQRANGGGGQNLFDLWAGDVQLFRAACTTPMNTDDTTTRRCPASGAWTNAQNGAHFDGGDLLFDSEVAVDACPRLYSSDGGVHRNTLAASPGCHNPTWTRSNVGYHGLWLWTMEGSHLAGDNAEQLLFGTQDNGTFSSITAGATPPTWTNPNCCDTFDVLATTDFTLGTVCCFGMGRFNRLQIAGANYAAPAEIPNYPSAGEIDTFNWGRHVNNWGTENNNVLLLSDNIWITDDIQANPIVWTALQAPPGGAGAFCNVQTSLDGGTPVFFAQNGQCTGRGLDQVWRLDGTADTTWARVDNTGGLPGGFGVFAVDPNNANRVFASSLGGATPQMVRTTDGGTNWTPDTELDSLMTGLGVFKYANQSGPSTNNGGARAQFQGYPQPVMLAVSPIDANMVIAGGVDSGVFLSSDGGNNWALVTDPLNPAASGIAHLPRPRFAYFDDEPAGSRTAYLGTQGRGVWRLAFPNLDLAISKSCTPDIVKPGDIVSCTLTVTNNGPVAASMVSVTDDLPAGFAVTSGPSGPGFTCSTPNVGPEVRCTAATLAVGSTMITYQARVPNGQPGDVFTNTAGVASANFDTNPNNNNASDTFTIPNCTIDFRMSAVGVDILGTAGDDVICGSNFKDRIFAGLGNDFVVGGGGDDEIAGGGGNDSLAGGPGNDKITGGDGVDSLYGDAGNDQLTGDAGADFGDGGDNTDYCATEMKTTACEF
ncbi:MAG: hypothetical protein ACRD12_21920 [Acidimicrobiales bacterium]